MLEQHDVIPGECTYPPCRRCGTAPAASAEHVVLNGLGGRKRVRGLWCEPCNNWFGRHVDAPFLETLHPWAVLLDAKRGDGDPVAPWKNAGTRDGRLLDVLPGGIPVARKGEPAVSTVDEGDRVRVTVRGKTPEEVALLVAHQARRHRVDVGQIQPGSVTETSEWSSALVIEATLGGEVWARAVAKMGLAAIMLQRGVGAVPDPGLDALVAHLGHQPGTARPLTASDPAARPTLRAFAKARVGAHCLLVYGAGDGSMEAAFLAFGALCFRVRLGHGNSISGTLVHLIDPLAGTHSVAVRPGRPPLVPITEVRSELADGRAAIDELIRHLRAVQNDRMVREVVLEASKMFEGRDDTFREEDIEPFCAELTRLLLERLDRRDTTRPLDPDPIRAMARRLFDAMPPAREKK